MATLVIDLGKLRKRHSLTEGVNTIGRAATNDICTPREDRTVSGSHAQILIESGHASIVDAGSRNGTLVNDVQIAPEQSVPLRDGDCVQFGDLRAWFDQSPEPEEAAVTGATIPGQGSVRLQISDDVDDSTKIVGAAKSQNRLEALEVNPEIKLKAVLDLSRRLVGPIELDALLPAILETLFNIFKYADRGCVLLRDAATGQMIPRAFRHRRADQDDTVRLSRTVVERVLKQKEGILSADASVDSQFLGAESIAELKIRSMMCVPLLGLDGEPTGIISIDSQNPLGQFTADDLELLMVVAGQASLSRETARLLQSYVAKQKQDNEMQIARDIQRALLPNDMPHVDGYEFFACYETAQAVGGDYYDWFRLPEGKIALSFGDVAGKGVPGALIMSRMSSCVQSTLRHVFQVEPAMLAINAHMCDSAVEGRFVTYVLAIVDTIQHTVTLANAGHMAPAIRHADGTVEHFDEDELVGPPIGVMDDYPYEVEQRVLAPGDTVVIVTDGVDDAMDLDGQMYSAERTCEFIRTGPPGAIALGTALLADVRRHAGGHAQNDDITIMAFGRNAEATS